MIARWKQDQSGQSMVEFALMFVSFMFVMAGIFDFSRALFYYNSLSEAARVGARYAIVHGENASSPAGPCSSGASCSCDNSAAANASAIRTAVLTRTTGMSPGGVTTTCSWPDQNVSFTYLNSINKRVTVTVSYTYQPILTAFIPNANITLQGQVTSFIQY
ncbi:MAG TPA: TadE/TadG family type IV pilus assembly protein [Dehalococcoidia bacterium]|nr:TadE/TadG family type IV pilus assembly protein [Dehalococcoidia bacterium]